MKTTKILISLCVAGLFATTNINAQVRIGSQTTPTKGAVLDLGGTGDTYVGGLKLPNVSLTNTTSMTGLTNSETDLTKLKGLTVYNTNASITGATAKGVGIYYWDGAKWIWMQNNDASTSMNWQLGGNAVTSEQKIGTTSNFDLPFVINNTERMRLNKNGYLGIGTSTPLNPIHIRQVIPGGAGANTIRIDGINNNPELVLLRENSTGNLTFNDEMARLYFGGTVNESTVENLSMISTTYKGNGTNHLSNMNFYTSQTYRMTIDSIGRIGIGTLFPSDRLQVIGSLRIGATPKTGDLFFGGGSNDGVVLGSGSNNMIQRSDSYPNLYLTKNSSLYTRAAGDYFMAFRIGSTGVVTSTYLGSIAINSTNNGIVYNTTSDKRLKENIVPTHVGIKDLSKIEVKDYNFISDPNKTTTTGFIAQDLYEIYPQAVTKGGDDVSENPWQVDYSQLVPVLVKAIQDQQKIIEQLEVRIKTLESK